MYIQQVNDRQTQLSQDPQLAKDQSRLNREVAVYSVSIAQPVIGSTAGSQFNQLAGEISNSYSVTDQAESRIRAQNAVVRFFMGGDTASAQTLLQESAQNKDRIQQMERDIQGCNCNQTIRDQLQQELTILSQDQVRISTLANQTIQDKGVIGGLFR